MPRLREVLAEAHFARRRECEYPGQQQRRGQQWRGTIAALRETGSRAKPSRSEPDGLLRRSDGGRYALDRQMELTALGFQASMVRRG